MEENKNHIQTQSGDTTDNGIPKTTEAILKSEEIANEPAKAINEAYLKQNNPKEYAKQAFEPLQQLNDLSSSFNEVANKANDIIKSNDGVQIVQNAINANNNLATAEENLVPLAYENTISNQKAILDANTLGLQQLQESFTKTQDIYDRLGANVDKSISTAERYYQEKIREREDNKAQTIANQLQYQNEVARLSGFGISDNMSHFIAGKMLQFTGDYDLKTAELFEKGQRLGVDLIKQRASLSSETSQLVSSFVKNRNDLYLKAKEAENTIKYLTEGGDDYKKKLINEIRLRSQEKNIELQDKLYKDIENKISLAQNLFNEQYNAKTKEIEFASSIIEKGLQNGTIMSLDNETLGKYARMMGRTPQDLKAQLKTDVQKLISSILIKSGKGLGQIDIITAKTLDYMSKGVPKMDALQQVAKEYGFTDILNYVSTNGLLKNAYPEKGVTVDTLEEAQRIVDSYPKGKAKYKLEKGKYTVYVKEDKEDEEENIQKLFASGKDPKNTITGVNPTGKETSGVQTVTPDLSDEEKKQLSKYDYYPLETSYNSSVIRLPNKNNLGTQILTEITEYGQTGLYYKTYIDAFEKIGKGEIKTVDQVKEVFKNPIEKPDDEITNKSGNKHKLNHLVKTLAYELSMKYSEVNKNRFAQNSTMSGNPYFDYGDEFKASVDSIITEEKYKEAKKYGVDKYIYDNLGDFKNLIFDEMFNSYGAILKQ